MDQGLLIAGAGLRAQLDTLDLLGNNLANSSTPGFKRDREFFRLFETSLAGLEPNTAEQRWMPVVQGAMIDFEQGSLARTDALLDVALVGPGFFTLSTGQETLYTRDGSFRTSPAGRLETREGYAVLDSAGQPITIPGGERVEIGEQGMVRVNGLSVAQLGVVEFEGTPNLTKIGRNFFQAPQDAKATPAVRAVVRQGYLESSNVEVPLAAVQLIQTGRAFQMLSRIANLVSNDMNGRAVEELGALR